MAKPAPQQEDQVDERLVINAWWLIKLRWVAAAGQLTTVLVVHLLLGVQVRLPALLAVISVTAGSNAALAMWFRRRRDRPLEDQLKTAWHRVLGGVMLLDLLSLTLLLYLSGGPANPFAVFYLVNLGLAAILLPARWAWFLDGFGVICLAAIFYDHLGIDELRDPDRLLSVREASGISLFQQGLFVAFVACGSVIVYFTTRLTAELRQRELALRRAESRRVRSEYLEALGTMAAGAAHELATPLSTIAVVAKEMERELQSEPAESQVAEDLRVIRSELDRCRAILDRMSVDAGHAVGEAISESTVQTLLQQVLNELPEAARVDVIGLDTVGLQRIRVPLQGLAQALRGVIRNALDASPDERSVRLHAECRAPRLELLVEDFGQGMDPETLRRAGEPFFTTKEAGQGMGLGLFLARSVVERLGGTLQIESVPGTGTRVRISLPATIDRETSS